MESAIVELAKLFKERNPKNSSNYVIGKVISPLPNLRINDGDSIILDKENLTVTSWFQRNSEIKQGDLVLMIPSSDEQNYIVIDKVVGI